MGQEGIIHAAQAIIPRTIVGCGLFVLFQPLLPLHFSLPLKLGLLLKPRLPLKLSVPTQEFERCDAMLRWVQLSPGNVRSQSFYFCSTFPFRRRLAISIRLTVRSIYQSANT